MVQMLIAAGAEVNSSVSCWTHGLRTRDLLSPALLVRTDTPDLGCL
jgi:hypothetical protein